MIINSVGSFQAEYCILKASDTNCIYKHCEAHSKHQKTEAPLIPKAPASKRQTGCKCAGIRFIKTLCRDVHLQCIYAVLREVELDPTKPRAPQLKMPCEGKSHMYSSRFNLKKLLNCLIETDRRRPIANSLVNPKS